MNTTPTHLLCFPVGIPRHRKLLELSLLQRSQERHQTSFQNRLDSGGREALDRVMCTCSLGIAAGLLRSEMAASSRSATARDFWSAFLDLNKNYRGYDGKLFHNDLDMAKRLLRPFPLVPSAASSRVSSRMHRFVEGQQGSNGENYENGERKLGFEPGDEEKNHYQVMRRDKENENFVEKPDVSINSDVYGHVCHEGEEIGTLNVGFPCESSPCDTMKAQTIDFQNKVLIDSLEDSENLSSCPIPWFGSDIGVHVDGGQNTGEVWTKTEHVKKQTLGVRPDFSIDLADVTMSISLRAITSLLERKRRYKTDDLNVCGNVAVLCGSWTGVGTLNVHRSDFRGVYNYIDGTVLPTLSLGDVELVSCKLLKFYSNETCVTVAGNNDVCIT